jgi:uncharacterized protein (UPF0332 family)
MSNYQDDYIKYRIEKSEEAFIDANILFDNERYNGSLNRLYYACYYIVSALTLNNGIQTQTHSGLKSQFNLHFVKTGIVSTDMGKLFSDLIDWRQKGDYGDMYDFDKQTVEELLAPTKNFIEKTKNLI